MSEHPEELLPWYANDTLAGEERERVERHLAGCAHCRAELALLHAMRREVKALDAAPGELVRAQLLKEARRSRLKRGRWMPAALAASLAVVVIQAAVLLSLLPRHESYGPLGARTAPGVIVQVRFAPDATEREMRDVLSAVNGSIVEGPGALGVYRVRLAAIPSGDRERIAAAIETLRAAAPVVTHVEREP